MTRRVGAFLVVVAGMTAMCPRVAGQPYPPPSIWVPAGTIAPVAVPPPDGAIFPAGGLPQPPPAVAPGPLANPDGSLVPPGQPYLAGPPGWVYPVPVYPLVPVVPAPTAWPLASATDGVYVDLELFISSPTVTIQRSDPQVIFAPVPPISLPRAQPGTNVSPLFELGYRFSEGSPYLAFSYRYVGSDGQEDRVNAAGVPFSLTSQFRIHSFGLDFGGGSAPPPTDLALWAQTWSFGWRIGVQAANLQFSTQVQRELYTSSIDNSYWAAGPHGRLGWERRFSFAPELSWAGHVDGSLLVGQGTRTSRVQFVNDAGDWRERQFSYQTIRPAPVLLFVTGLSYRPEALPDLRLSVGYVYEHWWSMGLVTSIENGVGVGTRGETVSHGLFLQARYDF